jgi:hypothetical protein
MNFIPCKSITIDSYEYNIFNKKSLHISIAILNPKNFPLENSQLTRLLKSIAGTVKRQLKKQDFFDDYYVSLTSEKNTVFGTETNMRGDKFNYQEL